MIPQGYPLRTSPLSAEFWRGVARAGAVALRVRPGAKAGWAGNATSRATAGWRRRPALGRARKTPAARAKCLGAAVTAPGGRVRGAGVRARAPHPGAFVGPEGSRPSQGARPLL